MAEQHRVLLVDPEWAHHRLVSTAVRERFPEAAVYSAGNAAEALDLLSCRRFDLVLVETRVEAGAEATIGVLTRSVPGTTAKVLEIAPSQGAVGIESQVAEIAQLVEQHLGEREQR